MSGSARIPAANIQATARDARGRKQYRYHPSYRDARDQSKFRRMLEFSEVLPILRERLEHDLRAAPLSRRQLLATIVTLLDKTLIRVGNDEYVRSNRSYGLTTLRRRHVQVDGATLRFSFRGKSGVEHIVALSEPRLAHIIQRCRDLPGEELFQYLDAAGKRQSITSDDVNAYLRALPGATSAPRTSALGRHHARRGRIAAHGCRRQPTRSRPQHRPGDRRRGGAPRQHARGLQEILHTPCPAGRLYDGRDGAHAAAGAWRHA